GIIHCLVSLLQLLKSHYLRMLSRSIIRNHLNFPITFPDQLPDEINWIMGDIIRNLGWGWAFRSIICYPARLQLGSFGHSWWPCCVTGGVAPVSPILSGHNLSARLAVGFSQPISYVPFPQTVSRDAYTSVCFQIRLMANAFCSVHTAAAFSGFPE